MRYVFLFTIVFFMAFQAGRLYKEKEIASIFKEQNYMRLDSHLIFCDVYNWRKAQ